MSKNPVYAAIAVGLSFLLALGAPAGLAAQSKSSSAMQMQGVQAQPPQTTAQPAAKAPLIIPAGPNYSKDIPWFPRAVTPYMQREVPEPQMANSPQLEQLIHQGQLQLSLEQAIQLAIENNLNIGIQRYVAWVAQASVLSALAGPPGLNFDPTVSSTLGWNQNSIPVNNPFITGTGLSAVTSTINKNLQANFAFSKGFRTGTLFTLGFNNSRAQSSSTAAFFNPSVQSTLSFGFQQNLLRGFGFLPNMQYIIEARNNSQSAVDNLENEVITIVANVSTAYWNLVYTRENVKVQQTSVNWAQKNLQETQAQEQIGTLAQLDVVTAESQLASSQQALIVAQTNELEQQTALLNLITRNPMAAGLENLQVVPTDSINTPPQVTIIPYRDAVSEAWSNRPDLLAQELALDNTDIAVRGTRNALLPGLTLAGTYGTEGLAGNRLTSLTTVTGLAPNTNTPIVDANGNPVLVNGQEVYSSSLATQTQRQIVPSGLLDAWNTLYNQNFPSYSLGLTLNIPLRNRAAQAASAQAQLQQRESLLSVQALKNTIAESVRNAQIAVQQGLANVQAAEKAVQLAQESLNAEQKKFQYGTSTDYNVILQERDLATAQGNEIQAKAGLLEAVVSFYQALGRPLLRLYNISVADAQAGHVVNPPQIPGTPINNLNTNAPPAGKK
jgi:outer membrane protein